jgi:hypothetical protein
VEGCRQLFLPILAGKGGRGVEEAVSSRGPAEQRKLLSHQCTRGGGGAVKFKI